jgi:hypothetical protein
VADPNDTFEQGRQGGAYNPGPNPTLADQYAYKDGQSQRDEENRRTADEDRNRRAEQDRQAEARQETQARSTSTSRSTTYSRTTPPGEPGPRRKRYASDDALKNPDEFVDLAIGLALVAGGIGWAVSALVLHRPDVLMDVVYAVVGACLVMAVGTLAALRSKGVYDAIAGAIVYGLLAVGAVYAVAFVLAKPEWSELLAPVGAIGALLGVLQGERQAIAEIAGDPG